MSLATNTFLRRVAVGGIRIMQSGGAALRTAGVIAGLLPDALAEAFRQAGRWTLPIADTPIDAIPHLLYSFGLPAYIETYQETLARLQSVWGVHPVAGSKDQIESQLELCGLVNPVVIDDDAGQKTDGTFAIEADNIGAPALLGAFFYGDGTTFGGQVADPIAKGVTRCLRYFRPARSTLDAFRTTS